MDVSISSRHLEITPQLEKLVKSKIGRLDRHLRELDTATVHFAEARNPRIAEREICEVTLSGHGHHLRAKVSARDPAAAVDLAEDKLERQIRKLRTKLQKRRHGRGETIRGEAPDTDAATGEAADASDEQASTDGAEASQA